MINKIKIKISNNKIIYVLEKISKRKKRHHIILIIRIKITSLKNKKMEKEKIIFSETRGLIKIKNTLKKKLLRILDQGQDQKKKQEK